MLTKITAVTLIEMGQDMPFTKDVKSVADSYLIE